ncbi:hypothetical protein [Actinomycetospora flava]|uniref:Uncharacterized protein n=1 Tax=Actinomycetospora flava TaxID=3129232 RepID=A0ABU8M4Z6_9PSEU
MTMVLTAVAGATAGAAAWLIAPWASMAVHGTVDQRQLAVRR